MNNAFGFPQSAVVIGGSSDIAQAILTELVPRGCRHIVLAGRPTERLANAAAALRQLDAGTVDQVACDALEVRSVDRVVKECIEAVPEGIDLVVIAVGLLGEQGTDEIDPVRTTEVVEVNFAFPAGVLAGLAEHLRQQGHGRIVVLSSVAGVRVRRANFIYGAAKAGLDAYAVGLAETLEGSGVRLHLVRPGFVFSTMTAGRPPARFATTPAVVARHVVQGIEQGTPVIWVPPLLRWLFATFRLLPQRIWRRLPG